jgi:hypothetical protein
MEDAHQESNKTKEPEEKWLDITAWLARTTKGKVQLNNYLLHLSFINHNCNNYE